MFTPLEISKLVVFMCGLVVGTSANLLIVTVKFMEWRKHIDLNVCDLIISSLGGCNLILQCAFTLNNVCFFLWPEIFSTAHTLLPGIVIEASFLSCSLWFSTWLCVYYCMKIVNCSHPFFLWLKVRFPKVVPWLLLGSVLVSLAITLPHIWDVQIVFPTNHTSEIPSLGSRCSCIFDIFVAVSSLALLISCCSAVMILAFLWRHMRRMQKNVDGFRGYQLDAHLGAAKTVIALLLLYIAFYINLILLKFENVFKYVCFLYAVLPSLNALILILGNSRLKKAVCGIILCEKCCKREEA